MRINKNITQQKNERLLVWREIVSEEGWGFVIKLHNVVEGWARGKTGVLCKYVGSKIAESALQEQMLLWKRRTR